MSAESIDEARGDLGYRHRMYLGDGGVEHERSGVVWEDRHEAARLTPRLSQLALLMGDGRVGKAELSPLTARGLEVRHELHSLSPRPRTLVSVHGAFAFVHAGGPLRRQWAFNGRSLRDIVAAALQRVCTWPTRGSRNAWQHCMVVGGRNHNGSGRPRLLLRRCIERGTGGVACICRLDEAVLAGRGVATLRSRGMQGRLN